MKLISVLMTETEIIQIGKSFATIRYGVEQGKLS